MVPRYFKEGACPKNTVICHRNKEIKAVLQLTHRIKLKLQLHLITVLNYNWMTFICPIQCHFWIQDMMIQTGMATLASIRPALLCCVKQSDIIPAGDWSNASTASLQTRAHWLTDPSITSTEKKKCTTPSPAAFDSHRKRGKGRERERASTQDGMMWQNGLSWMI